MPELFGVNPLIDQIADHTATYAMTKWGTRLTLRQQQRLKRRYFNSTRAALLAFEEISKAHAIRARATASDN